MSGAARELSGVLTTATRAYSPLTTLLGGARIFSHVPAEITEPPLGAAAQPYLQFKIGSKPWDTVTDYGKEHTLELWAWTEHNGPKQAQAIVDAVETLFRTWTPTMASHRLVNLVLQYSDVFRDGEGQTYCGYQRWRAVTEEI